MPSKNELVGKKFGKLAVIKLVGSNQHNKQVWLCKCECGTQKVVVGSSLKSGNTKSCGCLQRDSVISRNFLHGSANTRLYKTWLGMKRRCYNQNDKDFHNYGGRGILICEDWINDFANFQKWSLNNGYSDDLTIDRIDNNQGYNPENCKWSTRKEQMRNVRYNKIIEIDGIKLPMAEMAEKYNVSYDAIKARHKKGKRGFELIEGLKKLI